MNLTLFYFLSFYFISLFSFYFIFGFSFLLFIILDLDKEYNMISLYNIVIIC